MEDQMPPTNELETALAKVQADGDLADWETRREVVRQLIFNTVHVIVDQPVSEDTEPTIKGTPTFVSNGDDEEQAMLAIFTTRERALAYLAEQKIEGRYPIEVPGPRALIAIPEGVGLRINPNQQLGFVIMPAFARQLSRDIQEVLEKTQSQGRNESQ